MEKEGLLVGKKRSLKLQFANVSYTNSLVEI